MGSIIWGVPLNKKKNGLPKGDTEIMGIEFNTFREMREGWFFGTRGAGCIRDGQRRFLHNQAFVLH